MASGTSLLLLLVVWGVVHGVPQLVPFVDVPLIDPDTARAMIAKSLKCAFEELQDQKQINRIMLKAGVDSSQGGSYMHMHGLVRQVKSTSTEIGEHGFVIVRGTQELAKLTKLPLDTLRASPMFVKIWREEISAFCTCNIPKCNRKARYRTADGSCHNLKFSTWGQAQKPQLRFLPPLYNDGLNAPRTKSVTGIPLPSPREISNVVHTMNHCTENDPKLSAVHMEWGQFHDHDILATPTIKGEKGADIGCCNITGQLLAHRPACFPINIPKDDHRFRKSTCCMTFTRSVAAPNDFCDMGFRDQINQATSYIDASQVYGSSDEEMKKLRECRGGFLKMGRNGHLPPAGPRASCNLESEGDYCFAAGDDRVHTNPSLATFHLTWVREHNRIAKKLGFVNPFWDDEKIFQETRKIVIALHMHITYTEYLPPLLGPLFMAKHGLLSKPKSYNTVYNPKVDATIANVFGVAAFRFGHSQIPQLQGFASKWYKTGEEQQLQNCFQKPRFVLQNGGHGADDMARWLAADSSGNTDLGLVPAVRDFLFLDRQGDSLDLAAINIQRGRDHGIPDYNTWREWCGLPKAIHLAPGPGGLVDMKPEKIALLSKVYCHPDDIDLFTGGLAEKPVPGGIIGPLFACIIGRQFHNLKIGDRFWYENKFPEIGFTKDQLCEIKKMTLAKVHCANHGIDLIQPRVFKKAGFKNPRVPCKALPAMDLTKWKDLHGPTLFGPNIFKLPLPNLPLPKIYPWF